MTMSRASGTMTFFAGLYLIGMNGYGAPPATAQIVVPLSGAKKATPEPVKRYERKIKLVMNDFLNSYDTLLGLTKQATKDSSIVSDAKWRQNVVAACKPVRSNGMRLESISQVPSECRIVNAKFAAMGKTAVALGAKYSLAMTDVNAKDMQQTLVIMDDLNHKMQSAFDTYAAFKGMYSDGDK